MKIWKSKVWWHKFCWKVQHIYKKRINSQRINRQTKNKIKIVWKICVNNLWTLEKFTSFGYKFQKVGKIKVLKIRKKEKYNCAVTKCIKRNYVLQRNKKKIRKEKIYKKKKLFFETVLCVTAVQVKCFKSA